MDDNRLTDFPSVLKAANYVYSGLDPKPGEPNDVCNLHSLLGKYGFCLVFNAIAIGAETEESKSKDLTCCCLSLPFNNFYRCTEVCIIAIQYTRFRYAYLCLYQYLYQY